MIRTNGTMVQVKNDEYGEYLMGTAMRRTKLDGRPQVDYDDYTLLRGEDNYSAIGYFRDKQEIACCLLKYAEPKKEVRNKMKDSGVNTASHEDFGPQRFCADTGERLERRYVLADDVEPDTERIPTRIWDEEGLHSAWNNDIKQWEILPGGWALEYETKDVELWYKANGERCHEVDVGWSHNNMTMDEMREVYRGLKDEDLAWMRANKTTLKEIYKDHADDKDACMERETLPLLYNEDGELITDPNPDDVEMRMDAPIRTNGITELTRQELYIMGYASYVLAFNPYKVKAKLKMTSNVRKELRDHIADLCDIFEESEFRHPKLLRRNKKYARNWEELREAIEESWLNQDWEFLSREHLECYC